MPSENGHHASQRASLMIWSVHIEAVRSVLGPFKGLFRELKKTSRDHGDPLSSLHLRFARVGGAKSDEERPPLDTQDLLKFVSEKST